MTEDEREELIEKIAKAADIYNCEARAALAVAEPAIWEECIKIVELNTREIDYIKIAAAIREGKHD